MGQDEDRLRALTDEQLLAGLAGVVKRRNQVTAEFLAYLAELDDRRLYLELGFPSLFEYCVRALRLCESTAGRHIAAARVCRAHPEVFAWVASGELHASALSLLKKHLTTENAAELFECCRRQSARQVEKLLAARFPRPDVRDLVRRLPARTAPTPDVGRASECAGRSLETVEAPRCTQVATETSQVRPIARTDTPASPAAAAVASEAAEPAKPRRIEPLAADRYGVRFTADGEFCQLLERVRGLAAHRLPSGDLLSLLKRGLEAYERELEKERFAVGKKARRSSNAQARSSAPSDAKLSLAESVSAHSVSAHSVSAELHHVERIPLTSTGAKRTRRCPAAVARAVFLRDRGQCTFVASDGRQCCARRWLELDHIVPRALGGEDSVRNLRLRCRAHNQHYARQCFGAAHVQAAMEYSRGGRSTESRSA
ncbi:MAG TPA: HNH endonuclease [Polyangiaceae bacterium]|nr:HNH endonuclease [Polyangiaceae bacterium]